MPAQIAYAVAWSEPLLLTERGCRYRGLFERSLARAGVRIAAPLEFGSIEALKQCVIAGLGITVLPEIAARTEIADGRLIALPWVGPSLDVVTQVVWHRDKWLSPALRAFLDVARIVLMPSHPDEIDHGTP